MHPVVLVERTLYGDAYRYTLYHDRKLKVAIETEAVPVGKEVLTLDTAEVEMFRSNPEAYLKKVGLG